MGFQKIVLIIASILLLLTLIAFGISLYNRKYKMKFPPVISQCPDYWEFQKDSTGANICVNVKNLGKPSCNKKMNFQEGKWVGADGVCNRRSWARNCDIVWDGVTNTSQKC
jgi:hypothetical protein|tara:strand:- start:732 stop:1064 length:333 start_codon:yes stop_codon:yes gene_type:complete